MPVGGEIKKKKKLRQSARRSAGKQKLKDFSLLQQNLESMSFPETSPLFGPALTGMSLEQGGRTDWRTAAFSWQWMCH